MSHKTFERAVYEDVGEACTSSEYYILVIRELGITLSLSIQLFRYIQADIRRGISDAV